MATVARLLGLAIALMALPSPAPAAAPADSMPAESLVVNGGFEEGAKGWSGGRLGRPGFALKTADGNSWLEISVNGGLNQTIRLDPSWAAVRVSARMKVTDVVPGSEGWHDARLAMNFVDAAGKHVNPWPSVFHAEGSSDWVEYERIFKIPPGAARLDFSPAMFGKSGTAAFDDLSVTVVRLRTGAAQDMPRPAEAGRIEDDAQAARESSATRERICLNGLWRFLPVVDRSAAAAPPPERRGWGWFKVPGIWPKSERGAQRPLLSEPLEDVELANLEQAWYERPISVPAAWTGRRVVLDFTMLQTHARVWIDGADAGEVVFPGGELDITPRVAPGRSHRLALLLTARPLEKESSVFMAPERVITNKAVLKCKGLTGDVWLASRPKAAVLGEVHVIASTRRGEIAFETEVVGQPAGGQATLEAAIFDGPRQVKLFRGAVALAAGRVRSAHPWPDAKRWDLDSPQNLYTAVVTLRDANGAIVDQLLPVRFGFREFWIDGRDFYLNGTRVHLRALFTTNVAAEADQSSPEACRNTCRRLKEWGFNALITSNYNFAPGEVGYMDGIFEAADAEGVLATFSLPHVKDFNMKLDTPAQAARYRTLAAWLVRRAQNHPSVVMYAMNHNSTGYKGDQNPLWMDGVYAPDEEWSRTNPGRLKTRQMAARAAEIARGLDPTRPIYHHQSGNLGELYTVNIYLNWAPPQERSDWLEHWATRGVKPMFFVEWGLPHVSSWSSYRGPQFIWRTEAFQQVWDSEFAAAHVGQSAYAMTPTKIKSLEWEEELWRRGKPFFWSHLIRYLRSQDENYTQIQARFAADNWRSHRAWGVSAMLPWDQENLWRSPPAAGQRCAVARPFAGLGRPGIVPDAVAAVETQAIYSRDVSEVKPSELGEVFLRWNRPLCGFIAGRPQHFTEKGHVYVAGETVRKQLLALNDTRRPIECRYAWTLASAAGEGTVSIAPGDKAAVEIAVPLPAGMAAGRYPLAARFRFGDEVQEDRLEIDVLAPAVAPPAARIGLIDPLGQTAALLDRLGIAYRTLAAADPFDGLDLLIVGRQALDRGTGRLPGLDRVPAGLRVLVFEQQAEALEQRLGFRVNVHGLRQAFVRTPGHAAVAGLNDELLRDWRGAATLVPPHLQITSVDQNDPTWTWSGFKNTRVWRCGNWGSVATVLIEKPDRGDFLPLVDGGFDLQYAPLLEWRLGGGRVLFCQMDVTARSEEEPAAAALCANMVRGLLADSSPARRATWWAGSPQVGEWLERLAIAARRAGDVPPADALLVVGPQAALSADVRSRVEAGLNVLALGLSAEEVATLSGGMVAARNGPTTPTLIAAMTPAAAAGFSNADLHLRTRLALAALQQSPAGGNEIFRVLPLGRGQIVFCQAAPWMLDAAQKPYLRTSARRNAFLVARLLHNLGAADAATPDGPRYVQSPEAEDDPYRYYRW